MTADLHTLTGAYATHALSVDEQARFEEHLEQCEACRQEVQELRETTALLAAGVAHPPPAELRSRVLAEIATARQLAPDVADEASTGGPAGTAVVRLTRRGWFGPTVLGMAAALLVLVVALGVVTVRTNNRLDSSQSTLAAVSAVLAAPDAREMVGTHGSGMGRLVVSRSTGKAVFFTSGMPPAPRARDYQLWLMHDGNAQPVGLLHEAPGGRTEPVVVALTPEAEQFGVTLEPDGGSDRPTTPPLLTMALPT
jgi:anti-sigma-K factor RskA